jgi:YegS/Rv2252/BmrU family lipid kinase
LKVVLVFNPESGRVRAKASRLRKLDRILPALSRAGMDVDVRPTERPGHATEISAEAAREGVERVLGWGGDGTLNELARGLVGTDTALGVLPGGTVNVFAREVGIPSSTEEAAEVFASGLVQRIPVGMASGRPFLLMAGIGIDAEVVRRLKSGFKHTLGAAAFWLDGFRMLARYPVPSLRIRAEGRDLLGSGVVAGKIRRYGPRYFIASEAKLEEPLLHVVIFRGRNRRDYLRYLAGVVCGVHLRFRDVESFKSSALTVEANPGAPFQLDGEYAGETPVELGVRDRALAVVLPRR